MIENETAESITMRLWRNEYRMMKEDPMRALIFRIESVANHTSENDMSALSKLTLIRDLARELYEHRYGEPWYGNTLYGDTPR